LLPNSSFKEILAPLEKPKLALNRLEEVLPGAAIDPTEGLPKRKFLGEETFD
jgi:hypothetical protein